MAEENPKNEDADVANAAGGEKPYVILRPPVLTPLIIPGAALRVEGSEQGTDNDPMLSGKETRFLVSNVNMCLSEL